MALKVGDVNQENPEYSVVKQDWDKMSLLHEGGHKIRKRCGDFLMRRPRELQEVYQARLDRFTYHNILGTCFGWYRAALFKTPPTIELLVDGKPMSDDESQFYLDFRKNCDNAGTSFIDMLRAVWTSLALYKVGYVLVDVPKSGEQVRTLRDQKQAGVVDQSARPKPYAVPYEPMSVINWNADKYGNLDWCVLTYQEGKLKFGKPPSIVDVWYYYDRTSFTRYERERKQNEILTGKLEQDDPVTETDSGKHALAKLNRVPLLKFEIPDGLWLANRAYLPVLDHLNQDNSYGWALFMSNLAMPVIKSDQDVKITLSESGFIQLPANASYEWSEPKGQSFDKSAARVKELREEIFRAMYLTYQGKSSTATADGASGASKEMDMMPAQDVMNEYGDVVIAAGQNILDTVAAVRGDLVETDIRGFKFGRSSTLEQLERVDAVITLAIPSETFEKEVYKQAASEYLPDASPQTIEKIHKEIEAAPTNEEKEAQAAQQQLKDYGTRIKMATQAAKQIPQPSPESGN